MFHRTRKTLTHSYLRQVVLAVFTTLHGFGLPTTTATAADKPESPASFDHAKGFKPAQSDLTAVFLQIAGSLEYYGNPEPYLRHMKAEHERIEAKYQKQLGKSQRSLCPSYMDAAYFDRFAANWQHIAPQLGLESLAKNTGHLMQLAINGQDGKGTLLIEVFNEHQHQTYMALTNKKPISVPGFEVLKAEIVKCARLDDSPLPVANFSADQQKVVQPANQIHGDFLKIFSALDAGLPATDAQKVKTVLLSIVTDVGRMAESELEVAVVEDSIDELRFPTPPYSAEQETALTAEEKKTFASFLKKRRFTRADFPALDKFYSTIYDKLSERGKDEMHNRIKAGERPVDQ